MQIITDLAQKVGGILALVGALFGAWLNGSTSCETTFGEKTCTSVGEVVLNSLGLPDTTQLYLVGAAVGAVVGALVGIAIGQLWPATKDDLGL